MCNSPDGDEPGLHTETEALIAVKVAFPLRKIQQQHVKLCNDNTLIRQLCISSSSTSIMTDEKCYGILKEHASRKLSRKMCSEWSWKCTTIERKVRKWTFNIENVYCANMEMQRRYPLSRAVRQFPGFIYILNSSQRALFHSFTQLTTSRWI